MVATMDSVSSDVLALIVLACTCRGILALSRVSRSIHAQCEKLWPTLYERRFGGKGGKDDYRRLALTTGTVVIRDEKGVRELPVHNVKKFMEPWFGAVYVNADDQCIFNGDVLARDVVDITMRSTYLRVLTKSRLLTFFSLTPKTMMCRSDDPIQDGKRVVDRDNCAFAELEDGRVVALEFNEWREVECSCSLLFGARRYNIADIYCGPRVVFHDRVYISDNDAVTTIPVQPVAWSNHLGDVIVTTTEGDLITIDYQRGKHSVIESNVLPHSLIHCSGIGSFYVRLSL
jgi:hypothetical protein